MAIAFEFGAVSDVGSTRTNNEDAVYCRRNMLALADGVGGGPAAEVASAIATSAFAAPTPGHADDADPRAELVSRLDKAAERLDRAAKMDPTLRGMGTTLTAVVTGRSRELVRNRGGELGLVHVGDSRLYVVHAGSLFQLTRDHSLPQFLVDNGTITPAEADRHSQRNVILRSLTPGIRTEADVLLLLVLLGQRLILCSDGLSDYVPAERILAVGSRWFTSICCRGAGARSALVRLA